jgi:hypothetical protein
LERRECRHKALQEHWKEIIPWKGFWLINKVRCYCGLNMKCPSLGHVWSLVPSWRHYLGRLWKLWNLVLDGGSRSLAVSLWRLYQVPRPFFSLSTSCPSWSATHLITMMFFPSAGTNQPQTEPSKTVS